VFQYESRNEKYPDSEILRASPVSSFTTSRRLSGVSELTARDKVRRHVFGQARAHDRPGSAVQDKKSGHGGAVGHDKTLDRGETGISVFEGDVDAAVHRRTQIERGRVGVEPQALGGGAGVEERKIFARVDRQRGRAGAPGARSQMGKTQVPQEDAGHRRASVGRGMQLDAEHGVHARAMSRFLRGRDRRREGRRDAHKAGADDTDRVGPIDIDPDPVVGEGTALDKKTAAVVQKDAGASVAVGLHVDERRFLVYNKQRGGGDPAPVSGGRRSKVPRSTGCRSSYMGCSRRRDTSTGPKTGCCAPHFPRTVAAASGKG